MSQLLSTVTVIGIDIGKNSFHVVGLDGVQRPTMKFVATKTAGAARPAGIASRP